MSLTETTRLISLTGGEGDQEAIRLAARLLKSGKLVAFPTETVYGLGADGLNAAAVACIFAVKGRPQDNPLILHVDTIRRAKSLAGRFDERAQALADAFWPGPLTLVLPKGEAVPALCSAGLPSVAVRMPAHPVALRLIREADTPLAAPSANLSGRPSPTTAAHCMEDLKGRIPLILDGGPCKVGLESTVLSLLDDGPRLLRPGAVTLEQLEKVAGPVKLDPAVLSKPDDTAPAVSPGMKYKHYAPRARLILVRGDRDAFLRFINTKKQPGVFALVYDEDAADAALPCLTLGSRQKPEAWAAALFAALRRLDELGAAVVYAPSPSPEGMGLAVYNRLIRAAAYNEVNAQ